MAKKSEPEVPRPFIKCAGGKRRLLGELVKRLPKKIVRYNEGFAGGAALFFHLRSEGLIGFGALLTEIEPRTRRAYLGVRDDVDQVLRLLREHERRNCREYFELLRDTRAIDEGSNAEVAAWRIYVSKVAYNGLYRVNRKGQFNTSFGDYVNPRIVDEENLRACSRALAETYILNHYAATIHADNVRDHVYYFDPPYIPASGTASFTSYSADGFDDSEQEQLATRAAELKRRGAFVMLTNSDTPRTRELYPEPFWKVERVEVRGDSLNSDTSKRGKIGELIIT